MTQTRRSVLHGVLQGAAVVLPIPLLDQFLDGNGAAMASGAPLPRRFGSWFWGLGANVDRWVPDRVGPDYDVKAELKPIEPYKKDVTILSGFNVELDGRPNTPHVAGVWTLRTGSAPIRNDEVDAPSLDVIIANAIGGGARFRSVELTAVGEPMASVSRQSASVVNPSEASPVAFYERVFGAGFQNPNTADFKPDPALMVRQSVLSGVSEQRQKLMQEAGSADRQRLDQYFTSIREIEDQLALELQKPAPADACAVVSKPTEPKIGQEIESVQATHRLMTKLLVMALACNQTRVFTMNYSDATSTVRRPGSTVTHHVLSHEEPVDPVLGYQPETTWFVQRAMEAWADFLTALASVKEGDGRLLDHMLVYAHSDTSLARLHALNNFPIMFAGGAGGRIKTGLHIKSGGAPVTRVGLTAMTAMGLSIGKWGDKSMETSEVVSEALV
jgi:hypothetical protein